MAETETQALNSYADIKVVLIKSAPVRRKVVRLFKEVPMYIGGGAVVVILIIILLLLLL